MKEIIFVIGQAATGKSTSFRNLDHASTFLISVEGKGLPFKGWKSKYRTAATEESPVNMYVNDDPFSILNCLKAINERRPDIKTVIIDDFSYMYMNIYCRRATEKDWSKFSEITQYTTMILDYIQRHMREDIQVIITMHTALHPDGTIKPKTIGESIDKNIGLEGKTNYVFHSMKINEQYKFLTNHDGRHTARTPMDMYEDQYIDNDMSIILQQIKNYEEGE